MEWKIFSRDPKNRVNMKKIHYTKPSISDLEIKNVLDAVKNGWGEKCYEYIYKFEDSF